jgi:chorismate synthase
MSATYGTNVRVTIFGESHGKGIGLVLDGVPAGTPVDEEFIRSELARRAPGRTLLSTQRQETDAYVIESGVWNGHAEGTPICVLIPNTDQHSKDYSLLKDTMRPGHADYAGRVKYKGFNDYRGGGHFSGRLTAPLVWAGALAKQALAADGIVVGAHIARLARIADRPFNPLGETAENPDGAAETGPADVGSGRSTTHGRGHSRRPERVGQCGRRGRNDGYRPAGRPGRSVL